MAFDHSSLRWFEACSCKPAPRGPPSSSVQLRTLYIKSALVAHLQISQVRLICEYVGDITVFAPESRLQHIVPPVNMKSVDCINQSTLFDESSHRRNDHTYFAFCSTLSTIDHDPNQLVPLAKCIYFTNSISPGRQV